MKQARGGGAVRSETEHAKNRFTINKECSAAKAARMRDGKGRYTPDCELDDDDHSDMALNMLIV